MSDPDVAERLAYRLEAWKRFAEVEGTKCHRCLDGRLHVAIKETPAGELCIACWLTWEPCTVCGLEAGLYKHAGGRLCALCLNREPSEREIAEAIAIAACSRDGDRVAEMHMSYWVD